MLELEVGYLEQYLLSLYRKAFDQQILAVSPTVKDHQASSTSPTVKNKISCISPTVNDQKLSSPALVSRRLFVDEDAAETATKVEHSAFLSAPKTLSNTPKEPNDSKILDSNVHRCHSSLSHRTALPTRPSQDSVAKALHACHSQPLSMSEVKFSTLYVSIQIHKNMPFLDCHRTNIIVHPKNLLGERARLPIKSTPIAYTIDVG